VIARLGQEAPADLVADLGAEAGLTDAGADLLLTLVRLDSEPAPGALGQQDTAAAQAGLTVADPDAHAPALKTATETRLKMWIARQDLRHKTPPYASRTRGVTACF
jgi:hypothetical protein